MNKIALIYPYFGEFPSIFTFWLESVRYNSHMDIYIYTDNKVVGDVPKNVYIKYITFEGMREKIQKHFDFKIALGNPYKICDYRPAFGVIFQDVLEKYDFWGYGDIDVIWGDIANFLTPEDYNKYDRISQYGHFSLYRNIERMNTLFQISYEGEEVYRIVFSQEENFTFDEFWHEYGIEHIIEAENISEKRDFHFAGVERIYKKKRMCFRFELDNQPYPLGENNVFLWREGKLYLYHLERKKVVWIEEYAYVHFQKRPLTVSQDFCSTCKLKREYWVVPNKFMIGTIQEVCDYLESKDYKNQIIIEEEKFRKFREKFPDVY